MLLENLQASSPLSRTRSSCQDYRIRRVQELGPDQSSLVAIVGAIRSLEPFTWSSTTLWCSKLLARTRVMTTEIVSREQWGQRHLWVMKCHLDSILETRKLSHARRTSCRSQGLSKLKEHGKGHALMSTGSAATTAVHHKSFAVLLCRSQRAERVRTTCVWMSDGANWNSLCKQISSIIAHQGHLALK